MMNKNKILLTVNSLEDVLFFQKLDVSNFLFPLKDYSVGYNTFSLEEIEKSNVRAYILVNRLLTDVDIDNFLKLNIPSNVLGILIEDVGLYYALRDNERLELINFQNHLNNSLETVNFWLNYYNSLVLSTDITFDEVDEIIKGAKEPLILNTFGYPMIMYSRRLLLTNHFLQASKPLKNNLDINIPNQVKFKLKENEFGTAVFDNHVLDIREEALKLSDEKIKFYLFNSAFLSREVMERAIRGEKIEDTTKGFLNTKTIYKVVKNND